MERTLMRRSAVWGWVGAMVVGVAVLSAGEGGAGGAVAPAVPDPDAGPVLLQKVDFEKEGTQSTWREDGKRVPAIKIDRVAEGAHSGKHALRVTLPPLAEDEADKPRSRKVFMGVNFPALEDAATFRARLFVKGLPDEAAGKAVFDLIPRNAEKIVAYTAGWGKVPTGGEWQEVVLEKKLPAGVRTVAFMIRFPESVPDAVFHLDDISYELVP